MNSQINPLPSLVSKIGEGSGTTTAAPTEPMTYSPAGGDTDLGEEVKEFANGKARLSLLAGLLTLAAALLPLRV